MKYLIVGGVAGGASTAARLRRIDEKAEIIMFEKGAYVSYANCGLPYYIGDVIKEREKLFVQTPVAFKSRFNIDVRTQQQVVKINRDSKTVEVTDLRNGEIYIESYDKLVLSPGAEPIRPPLKGVDLPNIFTLRNVPDTDNIKDYISKHRVSSAVVIGAGFIGLEMAENLHELGIEVTVIEMANQVLAPIDYPMAAIVQRHIREKGVNLQIGTSVTGFESEGDELIVHLSNGQNIKTNLAILSIGVKPDNKLAVDAGLKIGESKGIWVNEYMQTSDPNIYAVGDVIEFKNPITGISMNTFLAGPANKQGRICADNIVFGNKRIYKGAINTAIVKVFDLTVGVSGMAAKQLKAYNIPHLVSQTKSGSHASYYPDAKQMSLQLIFAPQDGKILGAQGVGYDGVDKRIDVLATMIQSKASIYDLTEIEHAYAPPFSSAKDPVNMAGYVAQNILEEKLRVLDWEHFEKAYINDDNSLLIDVRTKEEHGRGTIPSAINIPVDDLRSYLPELPKDKTIYIFCEIGLRGYLAQRILVQNNFKSVVNLSGGYYLWNIAQTELGILNNQKKNLNQTLKTV